MRQLSFERHRSPADIIRHSVWLYARFTLSCRDVEEMLAERGLDISYETVRRCRATGRPLSRSKGPDLWPVVPRLCDPHEELGQAVDLVVVFAVRELQDLGLEVLQPGSTFGQNRAAALAEWRQLAA